MKILIIEDDKNKLQRIKEYLEKEGEKFTLFFANSYQAGLRLLETSEFDLLLLDMSLPSYDVTSTESGYKFRHFAGREIMEELTFLGKSLPVIIITAFDQFGEIGSQRTLRQLQEELAQEFKSMYAGVVFYSASEEIWKQQLWALISNNLK